MPEAPLRSWELELEKYKKFQKVFVGHNVMRPKELALLQNAKILQEKNRFFQSQNLTANKRGGGCSPNLGIGIREI